MPSEQVTRRRRYRQAVLAAALGVTGLAPSGSHLYAVHIWLHAWTDATLFVDGTQRGIRIDPAAERDGSPSSKAA